MAETILVWPDGAPGSADWQRIERDYVFLEPRPHRVTRNVSAPTLTVLLPDPAAATGTGVLICPGGAHHYLAVDHEGYEVAQWLAQRGIAAFVLKYRVLETPDDDAGFLRSIERIREPGRLQGLLGAHWPLALADAQQALRVVRDRAGEWGLREDRIGMLGFSAGGHLVAGVALASEPTSRPAFVAPIYGALLGDVQVPADAPPLFTALAADDSVALETCWGLARAWLDAGRSAEIHMYARGGHGFGMFAQGLPSDGWIERFVEWLAGQGLLDLPL